MPDQASVIRVVALIEPGVTEQQISAALSTQPDFSLVGVLQTQDKVLQELRGLQPHILLVNHQIGGRSSLDLIDDLAAEFPKAGIVAILASTDPVLAQQFMLAGARAFVIQPFTQISLLSTLRRVRDLETRRQRLLGDTAASSVETDQPLKTLAVFSPRGGVGCSTLAINLAVALREKTDQRVLLVEGKLLFGHLGLMLNLRHANSIADLVPHMHALDESMVRDVTAEHVSGVRVLLSPATTEAGQGMRPEALYNIVTGLRRMFDYIIVDAGNTLDDNTVTLLDASDRVLLVTAPDLAALHDTSRFIQLSRNLGFAPGKVSVVLNRTGQLGGVRTQDIDKALHHEIFAQIADDGPNALRSLNRGIPLVLKYPRSAASRGLLALADRLAQASTALGATHPTKSKALFPIGVRPVRIPTEEVAA